MARGATGASGLDARGHLRPSRPSSLGRRPRPASRPTRRVDGASSSPFRPPFAPFLRCELRSLRPLRTGRAAKLTGYQFAASLDPRGLHDIFGGSRIPRCGPVPDAPSERGDVDAFRRRGVGDDSMTPLEVESPDPRPVRTAVSRPPGALIEAAGVQRAGPRIESDVVHVLTRAEDRLPTPARIGAQKNSTARVAIGVVHTPGRKIEPLRIGGIDEQARWTIRPGWQRNRLPVIGAVLRDVERPIPLVADSSVLASPCDDQIQLTLRRQRQTPRERLTAGDPLVLHAPTSRRRRCS